MKNLASSKNTQQVFQTFHMIAIEDLSTYQMALQLRGTVYRKLYPKISTPEKPDLFDFKAHLWGTLNQHGEMDSSGRLVQDSTVGLPSEVLLMPFVADAREEGKKVAEFGRLISLNHSARVLKAYYLRLYKEAVAHDIDIIYIVAPISRERFYAGKLGAAVLNRDVKESFGSVETFAAYGWQVRQPSSSFAKWVGLKDSDDQSTMKRRSS